MPRVSACTVIAAKSLRGPLGCNLCSNSRQVFKNYEWPRTAAFNFRRPIVLPVREFLDARFSTIKLATGAYPQRSSGRRNRTEINGDW